MSSRNEFAREFVNFFYNRSLIYATELIYIYIYIYTHHDWRLLMFYSIINKYFFYYVINKSINIKKQCLVYIIYILLSHSHTCVICAQKTSKAGIKSKVQ